MKHNQVTPKGMLEALCHLFWLLVANMLFVGVFRLIESVSPNCRIDEQSGELVCVGVFSPKSGTAQLTSDQASSL